MFQNFQDDNIKTLQHNIPFPDMDVINTIVVGETSFMEVATTVTGACAVIALPKELNLAQLVSFELTISGNVSGSLMAFGHTFKSTTVPTVVSGGVDSVCLGIDHQSYVAVDANVVRVSGKVRVPPRRRDTNEIQYVAIGFNAALTAATIGGSIRVHTQEKPIFQPMK